MRRALRLTELFFWSRRRLVMPRTLPAAALAATLGRLMSGPLPKPQDFEALAPVIGVAWARRVADLDLWVFFRFDDDEVVIVGLTARPPVRVTS